MKLANQGNRGNLKKKPTFLEKIKTIIKINRAERRARKEKGGGGTGSYSRQGMRQGKTYHVIGKIKHFGTFQPIGK